MDIQSPFKANSQLAKACKSPVRSLLHPALLAQSLTALNASTGNPADYVTLSQVGPATFVVAAFVGVQLR